MGSIVYVALKNCHMWKSQNRKAQLPAMEVPGLC